MNTPTRAAISASGAGATGSPRTPQRNISSTFSSPGYKVEEDTIIVELGTRYLRTGLANESAPRSIIDFGPEQSRRLGDYRKWLPGYEDRPRQVKSLKTWTQDHELWQLDSREFDLGLMEDKFERAFRESISEGLLMDVRSKKVVLVAPSLITHAILSKLLNIMFVNFQIASVVLISPPTMAVVAAGQRSGLVVDIGWHETIITAVYEFREISERRTTRAMKALCLEAAKTLDHLIKADRVDTEDEPRTNLDFEYVEELVTQVLWCQPTSTNLGTDNSRKFSLRLPRSTSQPIEVPFSDLSQPVERALFGEAVSHREQDDHEHSLSYLLYTSLLNLPPDVRAVCMSRIMFVGGGSHIPGLKTRLLQDLETTVETRGWSSVWDSSNLKQPLKLSIRNKSRLKVEEMQDAPSEPPTAASQPTIEDEYDKKAREATAKYIKPQIHGEIRGIESMGPFVGASLMTALGIKSSVEIESGIFLQHGLAGPKKESESTSRPRSLGAPHVRLSTSDTPTFNLGAWA